MYIQKAIAIITIVSVLVLNCVSGKTFVYAQVPPSPPSQPSAPPAPSSPPAPPAPTPPSSSPQPPSQPSPVSNPSAPPAPSPQLYPTPSPTPVVYPTPQPSGVPVSTPSSNGNGTNSGSQTPQNSTAGTVSGTQNESNGTGDAAINTGNANSGAIVINDGNNNLGSSGSNASNDINIGNTGNGTGSSNSGDISVNNDASTIQINDAQIANGVHLDSISGRNDSSDNTGVDSKIITGDANTTATVINGVNTNIDGVVVMEFNVDDTHTGDIILVFPDSSTCQSSVCGTNGSASVINSGNGSESTNSGTVQTVNDSNTFQENSANVTNDLTLVSDSGNNKTNDNTGGDNSIATGDANVVATVGNFVNNNIAGAGEVILAVVNIFGDLIGNILLPEGTATANSSGTQVANTGNGSGSVNNAQVTTQNASTTTQVNDAQIINNINVDSNTGGNHVEDNTASFADGTNAIETGDASLDVNVVNIANSNVVDGETWWIVFVNDASGNWTGQIMGAPTGASMAGSSGTEFVVNADGTIIAKNTGNGGDSTNTTQVAQTNTTTTSQSNTATVTNNLNLTANTGKNSASDNTGGNNSVTTGDANVMANIMNFVNNNFVGGRVVVSVVNVFGSWLGSFVPPGEESPVTQQAIGGALGDVSSGNTQNRETSSVSNNSESSDTSQAEAVLGVNNNQPAQSPSNYALSTIFGGTNGSQEVKPGGIIEDDTITVPGNTRVASAKTTIPSWFWKIFTVCLMLVVSKKLYLAVKDNSQRATTVS